MRKVRRKPTIRKTTAKEPIQPPTVAASVSTQPETSSESPAILNIAKSIRETLAKDVADIEVQLARFTLIEDYVRVYMPKSRRVPEAPPYVQ